MVTGKWGGESRTKENHGTAKKVMLEVVTSLIFVCSLAGIILFGGCVLDITQISSVTSVILEKQNLCGAIGNLILELPIKCGKESLLA